MGEGYSSYSDFSLFDFFEFPLTSSIHLATTTSDSRISRLLSIAKPNFHSNLLEDTKHHSLTHPSSLNMVLAILAVADLVLCVSLAFIGFQKEKMGLRESKEDMEKKDDDNRVEENERASGLL